MGGGNINSVLYIYLHIENEVCTLQLSPIYGIMGKTVLKVLGSFLASVKGIFFPGFADFCPIKQSHALLRCLKIEATLK